MHLFSLLLTALFLTLIAFTGTFEAKTFAALAWTTCPCASDGYCNCRGTCPTSWQVVNNRKTHTIYCSSGEYVSSARYAVRTGNNDAAYAALFSWSQGRNFGQFLSSTPLFGTQKAFSTSAKCIWVEKTNYAILDMDAVTLGMDCENYLYSCQLDWTLEVTCDPCSSLDGNPGICSAMSICKWCDSRHKCVPSSTTCSSCSALSSKGACDGYAGCNWCQSKRLCESADRQQYCASCSQLSASTCATNSGCSWCASLNQCQDAGSSCSSCESYTSSAMCPSNCAWCTSSNSCQEKSSSCTTCAQKTTGDACTASTGCKWCSSQSACVESSETCSECAGISTQSGCNANAACAWCVSKSACLTSDATCPSCASFPQSVCSSDSTPDCEWCSTSNRCISKGGECATCSARSDKTSCTDTFGCTWCDSTGKCLNSGDNCDSCKFFTQSNCPSSICAWCATEGACLSQDDNCQTVNCETKRSEDDCEATSACEWCVGSKGCFPSGAPCPGSCSQHGESTCKNAESCKWCGALSIGLCVGKSSICPLNNGAMGMEVGIAGVGIVVAMLVIVQVLLI